MYAISRKDGVGEPRTVSDDDLLEACAALSNQGVHPLNIARLSAQPAPVAAPVSLRVVASAVDVAAVAPARVNSTWGAQVSDASATARIVGQHASLAAAGITVPTREQAYATGTRMADVGYRTQEGRKADHDGKQSARDAGAELIARVRDEGREDRRVTPREIADSLHVNGSIDVLDGFSLTEHAIRGLAARIESPMTGYIMGIRDRMAERTQNSAYADATREANNADRREIARVIAHECRQSNADPFVMRTRARGTTGAPDVFACVSTDYAPADAPQAVAELLSGLPRDAKGEWSYDPSSTAWELRAEV